MRITAEMSLYPLQGAALDKILSFIHTVTCDALHEMVVSQLSTQVRGEMPVEHKVHGEAREGSFDGGGSQALVVKFLNADLPIAEPPVLERAQHASR